MSQPNPKPLGPYKPALILHGGAGSISRSTVPPALYQQYHDSLTSYLLSTSDLLTSGSSAVEAACHAVCSFEDDPLFNCGRGSVFNLDGEIEMEASLAVTCISDNDDNNNGKSTVNYEGKTKRSAAVSMIRQTRHPILLAREVLVMGDDDGGMGGTGEMHGHLSGEEVEKWGWEVKGLERKGKDWFWTLRRWEEHMKGLKKMKGEAVRKEQRGMGLNLPAAATAAIPLAIRRPSHITGTNGELEPKFDLHSGSSASEAKNDEEDEDNDDGDSSVLPSQGTVGAVCMDSWGVIAVATSTGGLTNKRPGRIGDTPTVGAGFWAESWTEKVERQRQQQQQQQQQYRQEEVFIGKLNGNDCHAQSISGQVASLAKSELDFWLNGCFTFRDAEVAYSISQPQSYRSSPDARNQAIVEKQPVQLESLRLPCALSSTVSSLPKTTTTTTTTTTRKHAVAMSGTGNGDSFLRTTACRTTAAMSRFSSLSLSESITRVAGVGGELQSSAKERWEKTGEGQGGIIGIELVVDDESESEVESQSLNRSEDGGEDEGKKEVVVSFDFNCSGLWRAYFETDGDGKRQPKVMVFREEY